MKRYGMKLFFVLLAAASSCVMTGCGGKKCQESRVIAKINNYELTAADFRDEAGLLLSNAFAAGADMEKAKERALDEIITKKVLLQAAQEESFDKDKKFMKEIERYWEQALLKLLIKKKIDGFAAKMSPDIQPGARQKILKSELDNWVKDIRNSAKVRIYKDSLKDAEIK
ncbi:MAG: hypothetical protein WC522_08325 [Candidatus Omnitrophota bacterium]